MTRPGLRRSIAELYPSDPSIAAASLQRRVDQASASLEAIDLPPAQRLQLGEALALTIAGASPGPVSVEFKLGLAGASEYARRKGIDSTHNVASDCTPDTVESRARCSLSADGLALHIRVQD